MKNLLKTIILSFLFSSALAQNFGPSGLVGIWAASLDIPGPFFVVELIINEDGTLQYRDARIESPMPKPGCSGTYLLEGNTFIATISDCSAINVELPEDISIVIDLSHVTKGQLEGAYEQPIPVSIELYGQEAMPFKLNRLQESYFEEWDAQNSASPQ